MFAVARFHALFPCHVPHISMNKTTVKHLDHEPILIFVLPFACYREFK